MMYFVESARFNSEVRFILLQAGAQFVSCGNDLYRNVYIPESVVDDFVYYDQGGTIIIELP